MGRFDYDDNTPINPFINTGKILNPFYKIDEAINEENRYVILKTTEHGKYVRDNMLYYKFNGVEIFTEINNAIFVDRINNTLIVKDYSKALEEINPVDPEERQYVLIMVMDDDAMDEGLNKYLWAAMIGRSTLYRYIVDNIEINYMNPDKSIVLTDNVALKDALTVTQFINYLKNGDLIPQDDFDIEKYRGSEDSNE